MCDLAMAFTIGSTLLGAYGSVMGAQQQASAQASTARYNAQIANMNANLSERRSRDALERGAVEEQKKRAEVAAIKGKQQAAMAANGTDLTFGSSLDTLVDTAVLGEMDALTVRTNTYRESHDFRVDAANKRAQANLFNMEARNAKASANSGWLSAAGTVLTGAGQAYKQYNESKIGKVA